MKKELSVSSGIFEFHSFVREKKFLKTTHSEFFTANFFCFLLKSCYEAQKRRWYLKYFKKSNYLTCKVVDFQQLIKIFKPRILKTYFVKFRPLYRWKNDISRISLAHISKIISIHFIFLSKSYSVSFKIIYWCRRIVITR